MWLLRNTHKHIAQDTLSEYLDGRLQGKTLARVELQLADCDSCRQELDEIRATVTLMQQLPMEAPRRSFVMSAPPPPEPARARPMIALRAPNWVYAGPVSVAALAFAVTVSMDATGGLKSDPLRQDAEIAAMPTSGAAIESSARSSEAEVAAENDSAPQSLSAAAPAGATGDASEPEVAGGGATTFQAEAAPVAPPAPELALAAEPSTTGADGDASTAMDSAAKTMSAEEPVEEPAPIPELAEGDFIDDVVITGTSFWWRVLEVGAGVLAVLFLIGLALRWNLGRRNSV